MNLKLVSVVALSGAFAMACGDSGSGGSGGSSTGGNNNGGGDQGGTTNVTGGNPPIGGSNTGGGGAGTPACYDETTALNPPGMSSLVGLNLCTAAQVDGFYAACLAAGATEAGCTAFTDDAANTACNDCINAVDMNGNSAGSTPVLNAFESSQGVFAVANTAACEAVAQGHPECGPAISDVVFCYQTACAECDDPDFQGCAEYSLDVDGVCGQIALPAGCDTSVDLSIDSPQCSGADFEEIYTNVANYFCGPPA